MQRMNERPMRNFGLSRRELFEKIERDALNALPADDWEFAEWRRARVNLDYHIEVHDFLYSVPHALIRAEVDVRITARTVEIFHRGQRVGVQQTPPEVRFASASAALVVRETRKRLARGNRMDRLKRASDSHPLAVMADDRDRGMPRGTAPPTPPGIRVRTAAVRPS